ncbi:hypothetical protein QBC33DRAFT_524463 [Phialemonium atrogriseum]|uniref:Uncharacterized protein n=1 Tax=Phialemonium atrogriseum TaxID=1093897 RepID=A0AAJ0C823_9PEZI|nr:uncharacterized protein QBC33DRAFT_524463 [Phialemonium atrogriseum]KAK1771691.1 hypothetical protein QBC33DRAFT_524463 [Phialemonium atrogriseum]
MKLAFLAVHLLGATSITEALITIPGDSDHYATCLTPSLNQPSDWYEKRHTGDSSVLPLEALFDSNEVRSFSSRNNASPPSNLEECVLSGVCNNTSSCATYAADIFVSICRGMFVGATDYLSTKNYENLKEIAVYGVAVAIILHIAPTGFGYIFLNGRAGQDAPVPRNGASSNTKDPARMSNNIYISAVFDLCKAIRCAQYRNISTRFLASGILGDRKEIDGAVDVIEAHLDTLPRDFSSICSSLGISWGMAATAMPLSLEARLVGN